MISALDDVGARRPGQGVLWRRMLLLCSMLVLAATSRTLAQPSSSHADPLPAALALVTQAFADGGVMPARYAYPACGGRDLSPALTWTNAPVGVKTWALIVSDPDAPGGVFYHWVLYDVPAGVSALPEAMPTGASLAPMRQGVNGFGHNRYDGPCPPDGPAHHYVFTLYALDTRLDVDGRVDTARVLGAMSGHVLARARWVGRFRRH